MEKWFKAAVQFIKEAIAELRKVSWLSRKEAIASTIVIIILVILVAIFVAFTDFILARVLGILL
jgi:preprotein translocase subunit SecE